MKSTATVATITTVATLLLASTPLINRRLPIDIRYPRDSWKAMIPITPLGYC